MTAQDPDEDARRLSGEALREGDATSWFERLYAQAADGHAVVPWDRRAPHPLLVEWIEQRPVGPPYLGGRLRARRRCGLPSRAGISGYRF